MKKVKWIALALVLCLGLIGGAYAYWVEAIEVDGTVNTGDIDPKFNFVSQNDITFYSHVHKDDPAEQNAYQLPKTSVYGSKATEVYASASASRDGDHKVLTVTINDAYPWLATTMDVTVRNEGTTPVVLNDVRIFDKWGDERTGGDFGVAREMYNKSLTVGLLDNTTTPGDPALLEKGELFIHGGETATFELVAHVLGNAEQDDDYVFSVEIEWIQYNAYESGEYVDTESF